MNREFYDTPNDRFNSVNDPPRPSVNTLGESLLAELQRARKIQGYAREIGPAGMFLVGMIESDIRRAERAMMEGDCVDMLSCLQSLRDLKE